VNEYTIHVKQPSMFSTRAFTHSQHYEHLLQFNNNHNLSANLELAMK